MAAVSASAKVITLAQAVSGFTTVALTAGSEIHSADGGPEDLSSIGPSATVEATGRAGAPGTLIARRLAVIAP